MAKDVQCRLFGCSEKATRVVVYLDGTEPMCLRCAAVVTHEPRPAHILGSHAL